MQDNTLVNAADIARLADVGRSAVSNWRRRYTDFPRPAGGTPAVPLFALTEVEAWLRIQGKLLEVPLAERAWQELRARAGDDLRLAATLADAGELLAASAELGAHGGSPAVAALAVALGPADAFEVLLARLHETQGRGAVTTPPELADLIVALTGRAVSALDPACGTGELLLAALGNGARQLSGQDAAPDAARLAAVRLRLAHPPGSEVTVHAGDAMLRDGFPEVTADVVLTNLAAGKRAGTPDADPSDPRWEFGVPPRLEPELAWVQHMLAHLSQSGLAAAVVPAAAAGRRPGRRIRAQLLRRGALRAVIALSATQHLWLLRRPSAHVPASVLMVVADDPETVTGAWRRFGTEPELDEPGVARAVAVIDLLDDEVDVTPGRHISAPAPERTAERFAAGRERLSAMLGSAMTLAPELRAAALPREAVTIAELARVGYLSVHQAPVRGDVGSGDDPVLTSEDVLENRAASGRGRREAHLVTTHRGDVVVAADGGRFVAAVTAEHGAIVAPGLTLLRPDPDQLDAHFLAGVLRSTENARVSLAQTGSVGRSDVPRARVPRLPVAEQRAYGVAFRQVEELRTAVRAAAAAGTELAQLLADGVSGGTLKPPENPLESP
ncbi:MAG TPA: N-6 DNA methylase [Streptosporangiaceae bacterium]|nr:N-6 DNA methylase [Streptosporangiaceae bacterium]